MDVYLFNLTFRPCSLCLFCGVPPPREELCGLLYHPAERGQPESGTEDQEEGTGMCTCTFNMHRLLYRHTCTHMSVHTITVEYRKFSTYNNSSKNFSTFQSSLTSLNSFAMYVHTCMKHIILLCICVFVSIRMSLTICCSGKYIFNSTNSRCDTHTHTHTHMHAHTHTHTTPHTHTHYTTHRSYSQ